MDPLFFLAVRTTRRNPARTLLVILGLCVTGALLLDMTMLSGGLVASLGTVVSRLGFAVRVVPRGTLPFSGSQIQDGGRLAAAIAHYPGVAAAVPVRATNVYVRHGRDRFASFALGVPAGGSGAYTVLEGADLPGTPPVRRSGADADATAVPSVVINSNMVHLDGVRIGDMLVLSSAPGPLWAPTAAPRTVRVTGIADFYFDLISQRSLVVATPVLGRIEGTTSDTASLILVRMTDPSRADALAHWVEARDPRVNALSIQAFLRRAGSRLTYFRQFSLVLGTISVAVSFLLIATIITLSLGERLGEIAMLRAVGVTRTRVALLILLEGILLSAISVPGAVGLGIVISRDLDAILRGAPGVPESLHFFTLTTPAVVRTAVLLLGTGAAGGVYPAAVAARLGIAATLHAEVLS
jgi:putative ABC transport system permease protein